MSQPIRVQPNNNQINILSFHRQAFNRQKWQKCWVNLLLHSHSNTDAIRPFNKCDNVNANQLAVLTCGYETKVFERQTIISASNGFPPFSPYTGFATPTSVISCRRLSVCRFFDDKLLANTKRMCSVLLVLDVSDAKFSVSVWKWVLLVVLSSFIVLTKWYVSTILFYVWSRKTRRWWWRWLGTDPTTRT